MIPRYDEWKTTLPAEPEPMAYCDICGQGIYEGDSVIDYDGMISHEDCFRKEYRRVI